MMDNLIFGLSVYSWYMMGALIVGQGVIWFGLWCVIRAIAEEAYSDEPDEHSDVEQMRV